MTRYELPYRAMRTYAQAVGEQIDAVRAEAHDQAESAAQEAVKDHEARLHVDPEPDEYDYIPGPRTDKIRAVPHPKGVIPDRDLARMVERAEHGDGTVETIAADFGYPVSLAVREMARYKALYGGYVHNLAAS